VTPLLEGVRVIALDFRGHGLSEHAGSYGYADYESDVTWLLNELGLDDVTVAGHSLGGYIALLAATRSERIGRLLAIDVKSDWTHDDEALAERSREAVQRVEPERAPLEARLAKSVFPTKLDEGELASLAERAIEAVDGAGASAGTGACSRPSPSIRSPSSVECRAPSTCSRGRRAT